MDETEELLLANRRFLYAYASRAFAVEPDEAFLAVVADRHALEECALLDVTDAGSAADAADAADASAAAGDGARLQQTIATAAADTGLDALRSAYTRLFIGPDKLPAPPWESVYVAREPLLFQESTLAVRAAYRSAGYRAAGYPHEPDDHAGTELAFMAELAARTSEAAEAGDAPRTRELMQAQQAFLRDHLLAWMGEFTQRLAAAEGAHAFYPAFAALALLVCERDAKVLEELLAV